MKEPGVHPSSSTHRVAFKPIFNFVLRITLLTCVVTMVVDPIPFQKNLMETVLLWVISAVLYSGVAAFLSLVGSGIIWCIYNFLGPIRVTEKGLSGPTLCSWLPSSFLSWAEMEKVKLVPVTRRLGVPCLMIHSFQKGHPSLMIPLFLAKMPAFQQAVCDAASPLNPLRQSLENDLAPAERTKLPAF